MRIAVGLVAAALVLAGCASGTSIKSLEEVDIESWRADIVAWPSAASDPDMTDVYRAAVDDCDGTVDDLAVKMVDPAVDPTLLLVGVSYVCPEQQPKVVEAMREMQHGAPAP
ncbi:MAG TPA: hypothetical protein VFL67_14170 [Mycobacterium sp.]|nr:hypothetical protein [Mycobacterium sp.]